METTPVHNLNLSGVLSESRRIVGANYSHFLSLSLLFFPLSFSIIITPTLRLSDKFSTIDHFHNFSPNLQKSHPLCILILVYALAICAIATITYSTYHGFLGKPFRFFTVLKSLTVSFLPLVATAIVAHVLIFCISISFLILFGSIVMLGQNLGFVIDYNSSYFMWFSAVMGAIWIIIVTYFHVNWSLALVVVVAESKWGFESLMRSSYLVKGMRSASLSLLLYYGMFSGLFVFVYTDAVLAGLGGWPYVFYTVLFPSCLMMFFLMSTVANTVLYMYCKALHGELAIEIAEEFAHHYINLPLDDEKVPQVVTVVTA